MYLGFIWQTGVFPLIFTLYLSLYIQIMNSFNYEFSQSKHLQTKSNLNFNPKSHQNKSKEVIHTNIKTKTFINIVSKAKKVYINLYKLKMSSTFKNRIPKRKYRQRSQLKGREHLGLLEKKKDYKQRAVNYHEKQDKLKLFKQKAELKNQDEFYFKMIKSKKNQQGKIQMDEDDSDFDQKQYRSALKTQNFNIVKLQKSVVQKKIQRLKADLHMIQTENKQNSHKIFLQSEEQVNTFNAQKYFKTPQQLIQKGILNYNVQNATIAMEQNFNKGTVKNKYQRLTQLIEKQHKLTKLLLNIGYEKNLQTKERSKIKKIGKDKIHKFFMERKK